MNRTQRAKIRAAHEKLDMVREFKNDAVSSRTLFHSQLFGSDSDKRLSYEKQACKTAQKELRKLKKYDGFTGSMSESDYMEFIGV